ncbi:MAG: translation elongation factor Ts [bacterium]
MIDTKTISQLRAQTGAGMMECQQALTEANGDINQAVEVLRKKGAIKAAKKADRATKEGVIAIKIAPDHKQGTLVAINCETDFVAKNSDFSSFVSELATKEDAEAEFNSRKEDLILKIGENLTFGTAQTLAAEYVTGYLHANKQAASLVAFNKALPETLAYDIAMQIVAGQPLYLQPADVPADVLAKEKEVYAEQLKNEGKPEAVWEKIIVGKLNKYYEDTCLLNQRFIKDEEKTITQLLKAAGDDVTIVKFVRYQI